MSEQKFPEHVCQRCGHSLTDHDSYPEIKCHCGCEDFVHFEDKKQVTPTPQVTDGDVKLVDDIFNFYDQCNDGAVAHAEASQMVSQYRAQVVAEKEAQIGQMIKRGNEVLDQANKERVELMATKAQLTTLREALVAAEKALKGFVDKCDRGEARSTKSYAEFKESLTLIHAALNTEKK